MAKDPEDSSPSANIFLDHIPDVLTVQILFTKEYENEFNPEYFHNALNNVAEGIEMTNTVGHRPQNILSIC